MKRKDSSSIQISKSKVSKKDEQITTTHIPTPITTIPISTTTTTTPTTPTTSANTLFNLKEQTTHATIVHSTIRASPLSKDVSPNTPKSIQKSSH